MVEGEDGEWIRSEVRVEWWRVSGIRSEVWVGRRARVRMVSG